jgi:hypothetical protein
MKRLYAALLISLPLSVSAATATLKWNPPADLTGIAGYELRYGTAAGARTKVVDVPGATVNTVSVADLPNGTTYYFAVRSRDANKTVFSDDSNEVSLKVGLPPPTGLSVSVSLTVWAVDK